MCSSFLRKLFLIFLFFTGGLQIVSDTHLSCAGSINKILELKKIEPREDLDNLSFLDFFKSLIIAPDFAKQSKRVFVRVIPSTQDKKIFLSNLTIVQYERAPPSA